MTSWSPQQDGALRAIAEWYDDPSQQVFYLAGYAGTGKTTIAKEAAASVSKRSLFAAFTGKAALVLQSKGCEGASTIHSLIYRVKRGPGGVTFVLNPDSEVSSSDLVVIDEVSMVGPELGADLVSYGKKVLVLGDPAQLPPVNGAGYFTSREPDFMLTEVHRQAAGNPIIRMSMDVREGKRLRRGAYGESRVIERGELGRRPIMAADQVLVGLNRTRHAVNGKMRAILERDPGVPQAGDRLVCLRNNRERGLLNGGLWTARDVEVDDEAIHLAVSADGTKADEVVEVSVRPEFFSGQEDRLEQHERKGFDEFTYGYALTVHKSQGSQWDDVVLFDESGSFRDHAKRWLYTGLTRAAERVTVVLS